MKDLLKKYGVIKTGHFKLSSGKHSNQYINKDAIYSNPMLFDKVLEKMWYKISEYENTFDIITGPAIAGAILAAPISIMFDKIFVYPEKVKEKFSENMIFRRGYDKILKGKRVWIVEDIVTTGGSIEKTINAVEKCNGSVVGISVIWNRGRRYVGGFPTFSLINEFVPSYWPDECPQCQAGEKLQDPKEE